jgi:hypothetical protein
MFAMQKNKEGSSAFVLSSQIRALRNGRRVTFQFNPKQLSGQAPKHSTLSPTPRHSAIAYFRL